jgi:predicted protein tyrosine phosphatase
MKQATGTINICGVYDLESIKNAQADYVVSIMDPDTPEPESLAGFPSERILMLRFHDIIEETGNLTIPQESHMRQLLEFAPISKNAALLVHCAAGVSRSTAAAILILAQRNPMAAAGSVIVQATSMVPNAWPNWRMIEIGDALLHRDGQILTAVKKHYVSMQERYPKFFQHLSSAPWSTYP